MITEGVSFLFVGSERLPAIMHQQVDLMNQVPTLSVDYLERDAFRALVTRPTAEVLEFTDAALLDLEGWSARNPYFGTLLCREVWNAALERRDYIVGTSEISAAVRAHAERSDVQHYQHFWADSASADDAARGRAEEKAADVLVALTRAQGDDSRTFVARAAVKHHLNLLQGQDFDSEIDDLIGRRVLELDPAGTGLLRCRVPLLGLWLRVRGAADLREATFLSQRVVRNMADIRPEEILTASAGLVYNGVNVTSDQVTLWLRQFGDAGRQRLMLPLLRAVKEMGLHDQERFLAALELLDRRARRLAVERGMRSSLPAREASRTGRAQNWYATAVDGPGRVAQSY